MDVLKFIKNDDELKVIPVIILTSSESNDDIMQAYVIKPIEQEKLVEIMYMINQHWFEVVSLPH